MDMEYITACIIIWTQAIGVFISFQVLQTAPERSVWGDSNDSAKEGETSGYLANNNIEYRLRRYFSVYKTM